jgi:hypothetical protein
MKDNSGHPLRDGPLPSVEPVPVSPLRAAVPDAEHTIHIQNGRSHAHPSTFGNGWTWCGKKLIGQPQRNEGPFEIWSSYGADLWASMDPALATCSHCEKLFEAAYSDAFPDGLKPLATFRFDSPADMDRAKDVLSPEALGKYLGEGGLGMTAFERMLSSETDGSERCSLGVGCDEYGVCYANAHDKPEMCPAKVMEARSVKTEGLGPQDDSAGRKASHGKDNT